MDPARPLPYILSAPQRDRQSDASAQGHESRLPDFLR
jgi:hypothetical protein